MQEFVRACDERECALARDVTDEARARFERRRQRLELAPERTVANDREVDFATSCFPNRAIHALGSDEPAAHHPVRPAALFFASGRTRHVDGRQLDPRRPREPLSFASRERGSQLVSKIVRYESK